MRFRDLAAFALSALRQQKVRTMLTVIGVMVGTFTLVMSLSIGRGVDHAILSLFRDADALRKIEVRTRFETREEDVPAAAKTPTGVMSDAKRKRLEAALSKRFKGASPTELAPLTPETLLKVQGLNHVQAVQPSVSFNGKAELLGADTPEESVEVVSATPGSPDYRDRLIAGGFGEANQYNSVIVHEYLLYRWGFEGDDVGAAIGRKIRIKSEFRRSAAPSLLAILKHSEAHLSDDDLESIRSFLTRLKGMVPFLPISVSERTAATKLFQNLRLSPPKDNFENFEDEFTISGVVRQFMDGDPNPPNPNAWRLHHAEVIMPPQAAASIYLRTTWARDHGFENAVVTVDDEAHVKSVAKELEKLGLYASSLAQIIDTVRMNLLLITIATTFVAVVALTVAALGITNTMIMSVLERTREIGIIKALGARNGQIQAIFLIEGVLIGLLGGLLGLALAYLASFPGDRIAKAIMEPQTHTPIPGSIFIFPAWLVLGAPLIACLITTLAAVYPARRASRVDPITSLRHE